MPTPTQWLDEFTVNTGFALAGGQSDPQIIGLSNGNILVVWVEAADGGIATATGQDIIGKIFDAEGNLVRDSFQINTFDAGNERDFDVAATNDGGFVIVYLDADLTTINQSTLRWQHHDGDGDFISGAVVATENISADALSNPQVSVNQLTNQSIVTFTDKVGSDFDVRAVTVTIGGTVGSEFDVAQNGADFSRDGDVAWLANGNIVSVYEEGDAGNVSIEFSIRTSTGTPVVGQFNINNTTPGSDADPRVAALADGNFVVTWTNFGNVEFAIYTPTGVLVAEGSVTNTANDENEADVVAMSDGGFMVVWDDDDAGAMRAQWFLSDGTKEGSAFDVSLTAPTRPDVGMTTDGRFLFAWNSVDGDGEILASIWDPRDSIIDASNYDRDLRNIVDTEVITGRLTASTIYGDDGSNTIFAQDQADVIFAGGGTNTVFGGDGADTIFSSGDGEYYAEEGDDLVYAGSTISYEVLDGGSGIDTLDLTSVNLDYTVNLASGLTNFAGETFTNFERVFTGAGNDNIVATDGSNYIDAGNGNDTINAGAGDDLVVGGAGDDAMHGGAGIDTASYFSSSLGVIVSLKKQGVAQDTAGAGTDFLTGFENLTGSVFRDRLLGDDAANRIEGLEGDDRIYGYGGQDVLVLDGGNDRAWGGDEDDRLYGRTGNDRLYGDAGNDRLFGEDGDDRLIGGAGDDEMRGGTGGDIYFVDDAGDTVIELAGEGTDRVVAGIDYVLGDHMEVLRMRTGDLDGTGNALDNLLRGVGGANVLDGMAGNDDIYGGTGNDTLVGGAGDDRLYGEVGTDSMTGGTGLDFFIFQNAGELGDRVAIADRITDFSQADGDRMNVRGIDANTNAGGDQNFAFIGTGAFTGTAGQLRYFQTSTSTVVEMDVDGDGTGDLYIRLDGQIDLTAGDFVL